MSDPLRKLRFLAVTLLFMLAPALTPYGAGQTAPQSCGPLPISNCLYYSGDYDRTAADGRVNFVNGDYTAFVYDNFTVGAGGWNVTSVFTNETYYTPTDFSKLGYYEIRKGVSAGNGGTVVASGTAPMVETPNEQNFTVGGVNLPGAFFTISGLNIYLDPDQYWMTVTPVDNPSGACCYHPDEYFEWPTAGSNGFNIAAHTPTDSFFSSSSSAFNANFDPNGASYFCGPNLNAACWGWSMGLGGYSCQRANVTFLFPYRVYYMEASFAAPSGTVADFASACSFDYLDWQNQITQNPANPLGSRIQPENPSPLIASRNVVYLGAPIPPLNPLSVCLFSWAGCSLIAPPTYFDPPQGGYTYALDVDPTTDSYPFYLPYNWLVVGMCQVQDFCPPLPYTISDDGTTLSFVDAPAEHQLSGEAPSKNPSGNFIAFQTFLVGVSSQSSSGSQSCGPNDTHYCTRLFSWNWNSTFNGTAGGVEQTASIYPIDPGSGTGGVTLTGVDGLSVPTVMVTPSSVTVTTAQTLTLLVAVSGGTGNPAPTGSVILTSGTYNSPATTLSNGAAALTIPPASLGVGTDMLMLTYVPDPASNSIYTPASGSASATVITCGVTPPVTTASLSGPLGNNGWYTGAVLVALSATDASSPVAQTFFSLDGPPQAIYSAPFTVSGDAVHQLTFYSVDLCSNQESPNSLTIKIDDTPPVTTAAISGPAGSNGWYRGPLTVNFSATDNLSGVASTMFSTNGGATWTTGTSVTLTANGVYNLLFHSTDVAGNTEAVKSIQVMIDQTPPTIACSLSPLPNANGWNNTSVTVSFGASDPVSGIASVSPAVTLTGQGANQAVTGMATDDAGNSASTTCLVNIDLTPPEAYLQFDPTSKDVDVYGTDALSGVPPGPVAPASVQTASWDDEDKDDHHWIADWDRERTTTELRTYKISDLAGNTLLLTVKVAKDESHVGWHILSLQYKSNPALVPTENHAGVEWVLSRDGALETLDQDMRIGRGRDSQDVDAVFDSRENDTIIQVEGVQKPVKKPGLDLLRLATQRGTLTIQF
jgi:hypothetical protein